MKRINWNSPDVLSILSNDTIGLKEKAEAVGCSMWHLCRKMKALGIKQNLYWRTGLDRPATNRERKARYNAKRKAIGWKYLYQVK